MSYELEPEELYNMPFMDTTEEKIEQLRGFRKGKYRLRTIKAGSMVYAEIFPVFGRRENRDIQSKAKYNRTPEEEREHYNRKQARRVKQLINANFVDGDTWATFDYDNGNLPLSHEVAVENMQKFNKRVQYYCSKHNIPNPLYIYDTETYKTDGELVRIHHHYITDFRDRTVLESLWKHGSRSQTRVMASDERGFDGMGSYIVKAPVSKTTKKNKSKTTSHKSFNTSKGLKQPTVYNADSKISTRKAHLMAASTALSESVFAKLYEGYKLNDVTVAESEFCGGVYIYASLRKQGVQTTAVKNLKLTKAQVGRIKAKLASITSTRKEIESLDRQLENAKGTRIPIVKRDITRLNKTLGRLIKWFDVNTKRLPRKERALLRDRFINNCTLDKLSHMYYYTDKSSVSRQLNKIIAKLKM